MAFPSHRFENKYSTFDCCRFFVYSGVAVIVSQKVPTFKLSVTLVKSQPIFKIFAMLKAYEICYKIYMTLPTSP